MPVDPICGMRVSEDTPFQEHSEGVTYYFCSQECQEQFSLLEEEEVPITTPERRNPNEED